MCMLIHFYSRMMLLSLRIFFSMKNLYNMSSLPANVIANTTLSLLKILIILNIHLNQSMRRLIMKLLGGARDQGL
jgi:hypothetical protein